MTTEEPSANASTTMFWACNLLVRMGFTITWSAPPTMMAPVGLRWRGSMDAILRRLRRALPPGRSAATGARTVYELAIAPTAKLLRNRASVWSDGWTFWTNEGADERWNDFNPLAAAAAGIAGAIAINLMAQHGQMPRYRFSLLDYSNAKHRGHIPRGLRVPTFLLAGAGAVGSSFAMGLASCQARGRAHVVDTEAVAARNVRRYPLTMPADIGYTKAEVVSSLLTANGVATRGRRLSAARYLHRLGPKRVVVSAVDTPEARIAIAKELPLAVLDGANAEDEPRIEIMATSFPPASPCLACPYATPRPPTDITSNMSRDLGLTVAEIVDLREHGTPVTEMLRRRIARRTGLLLPKAAVGEGIDTAYTHHYCGSKPTQSVRTVASRRTNNRQPGPPIRIFAPAMTGILLAGELIKRSMSQPPLANSFSWNLEHRPNFDMHRRRMANQTCPVCSDSDYASTYEKIHRSETSVEGTV